MKLYDVYYYGNSFDSNIPLPDAEPDIQYASCKNWGTEYLVPERVGDKWEWKEVKTQPTLKK